MRPLLERGGLGWKLNRLATAELLAWLSMLDRFDLDIANPKPGEPEVIAFTYSILAKGKDDLSLLQDQAREKSKN